jgi:hypothetical protein
MADIDFDERGVVYVERESGSVKPVLLGLLLGLGLGLLFAPQSGEQTRRGSIGGCGNFAPSPRRRWTS